VNDAFPLSRRRWLQLTSLAASGSCLEFPIDVGAAEVSQILSTADLPVGDAPPPLDLPHFPSRLHAFLWRNWPLVPLERLAAVLDAPPNEIRDLGLALGLGPPPSLTENHLRRSYLTVLRRNWHLLPYSQLLTLLDWSADHLAFTLREDDFLWIKLGNRKPKATPLRWSPDHAPALLAQAAEIARVIHSEFGPAFQAAWNPMFRFVEELSSPPAPAPAPPAQAALGDPQSLRFCYSYFALYGDPLLEPDLDPYPEGYLARLAQVGVTGVWLQGLLSALAPFPWDPSRSTHHLQRLANLRRLVQRARRHGIRLFLYLNEPRSLPLAFFDRHPQLKGAPQTDHAALCTSVPEVREHLATAVETICRAVPDLGGFFTITASENPTNCWSHGRGADCPRCRQRSPSEVIAEVNATFQQGINRAGHLQRLIAWDWGWADDWAPDLIARLPKKVALMSVSEWNLPIARGGIPSVIGEYSLSAVGPGPRATRHWELARQHGLKTLAKIQANCTWELSALPSLPVLRHVAQHAERLRNLGLDGIMLGWTLGGYPSTNLEMIAAGMAGGTLEDLAVRRAGTLLAPALLALWDQCSSAFAEFPYHIGVVYNAPLQLGPANLLWPQPTRYAATMVGLPYDDLNAWRGPYPPEIFAAQLLRVADGWSAAARQLDRTLQTTPDPDPDHAAFSRDQARLAHAGSLHFRSVALQSRCIQLRDQIPTSPQGPARDAILDELQSLLRQELTLARTLHDLQRQDPRLGFEASNHYYYLPVDLAEKILNIRHLLDHWLPSLR
jgi:hypothetical protein